MGKGKTSSSSGPSQEERTILKQQGEAQKPVLDIVSQMIQQVLKGGKPGATIPFIQNAVESARTGVARASRDTDSALARTGVTGPFARNIQAEQRMTGEFDVSNIASAFLQQLFSLAPNFALGQGSPIQASPTGVSKSSSTTDFFQSLVQGLTAGAGLWKNCWIAYDLYGHTPQFFAAWYWVNIAWQGHLADTTRVLYSLFGRAIVKARLAWLFKPLIDIAVRRGMEAIARGR